MSDDFKLKKSLEEYFDNGDNILTYYILREGSIYFTPLEFLNLIHANYFYILKNRKKPLTILKHLRKLHLPDVLDRMLLYNRLVSKIESENGLLKKTKENVNDPLRIVCEFIEDEERKLRIIHNPFYDVKPFEGDVELKDSTPIIQKLIIEEIYKPFENDQKNSNHPNSLPATSPVNHLIINSLKAPNSPNRAIVWFFEFLIQTGEMEHFEHSSSGKIKAIQEAMDKFFPDGSHKNVELAWNAMRKKTPRIAEMQVVVELLANYPKAQKAAINKLESLNK